MDSSSKPHSATTDAAHGLGADIARAADKAARKVGIKEKSTGEKLKDDAKNVVDAAKMDMRRTGH